MNPPKIPRGDLERYCRTKFTELGMISSCIQFYIRAVRHMADFMEKRGFDVYTPDIGKMYDAYIEAEKMNYSDKFVHYAHLVVRRIDDSFNNVYRIHVSHYRRFNFQGEIGEYAKKHLEQRRTHDRIAEPTYREIERQLGRLCLFCQEYSVTLETITRDFLIRFIDSGKKSTHRKLYLVGKFFAYLWEQGAIKTDYSHLFKNFKYPSPQKIVQYYTAQEVKQIEESIDRTTRVGKLKYVIVLLASRLGLRVSDIAALKWENIDWEKCTINLIQYKTKGRITLPLTEDVGMAIIDYARNARPKVALKEVLITLTHPYRTMTPHNVGKYVTGVIRSSGVEINGRPTGAHSLRHSLATILINKEVPLTTIAEALGHASTESTTAYVAVNITSLLECSLDVPEVDHNFYIQKGGYFYGM